jgi:hypothetical protein
MWRSSLRVLFPARHARHLCGAWDVTGERTGESAAAQEFLAKMQDQQSSVQGK